MNNWIERWVLLRKKELISYPEEFPIHDVYQTFGTPGELRNGFKGLYGLFIHCYEDILEHPAKMLLPVYDREEYGYFSREARKSREESYRYAKVLYASGCSGELQPDGGLYLPADALKEQCRALKLTNIHKYLKILGDYGLMAEGTANCRQKSGAGITISFPDNRHVMSTLHLLAVKSHRTGRFSDFCRLHYKLFEGDWDTAEYGCGADAVSDVFHSQQDRMTAQLIHEELLRRNYCYSFQDWNEGPQIRYYRKKGDRDRNANASFWIASMDTDFIFYFRIRNAQKLPDYLKTCPDSVIQAFSVSDSGCANRSSGKCVSGISYPLGGNTIWRCGCCSPNFQVTPDASDYLYYIDAVEATG